LSSFLTAPTSEAVRSATSPAGLVDVIYGEW
jgi:hypothetical protein